MRKKFEQGKAREGAGILGVRGFLTFNFQNSFLGAFGAKSGEKGVFGPNFCKSLEWKKDEYIFKIVVFIIKRRS